MRNNITNLTAAIKTMLVSGSTTGVRIENNDVAQYIARGANVNGGDALAVLNYLDKLVAGNDLDVHFEPNVDFDKASDLMKLKPREDTDDVFDAISQLLDDGVDFYSILTNAAYCSRKASKNVVTVLSRWWHESRVVAQNDKQDALNAAIGSLNVSVIDVIPVPKLPYLDAAQNVAAFLSGFVTSERQAAINTMINKLTAIGYDVRLPVPPLPEPAVISPELENAEYLNAARERLAAMGYDVIKINAPEYEKPCRMVALNGRTKMSINDMLDSLNDDSYDIPQQFADFLDVPHHIGRLVVHGLRSWLGSYYILEKGQVDLGFGAAIAKTINEARQEQVASGGIISSLAVTRKTADLPTLKLDPNGTASSSILGGYVTRSDDQERINNVVTANNVHDIIDALSDTKNVRYTKAVLWLGAYAHTWKKYS